jgi:sulfide dehydrogenase [flavocytochrome c] flavoprotein subunit
MVAPSRRRLLQSATAAALWPLAAPALAQSRGAKIVVIGGGFGGATAAKYLRVFDPALDVTLIEPDRSFVTCPFSNDVLAGGRTISRITHGYRTLAETHGVRVIADSAIRIDADKRTVTLAGGTTLAYDKLVVSPGIDMRWGEIQGYDEQAAERLPHAWKAGPQTLLLRRQLEAMQDGGTFLIVAPANPYRCPPAIYERASLVASYFKRAKPRAKILIMDAKDQFPAQPHFEAAWTRLYGDMIEWVPLSQDGKITEAQPGEMAVVSEFGETHQAAVINLVPPQIAGKIALDAGLANQTGWCPIDQMTFESTLHKDL